MWAQDSGNAVSQNTVCIIGNLNNAMFRLALRYQLRTGDSHLTLEESQTIGNKCNRLQKLIDMFEHQADRFLLHHQSADDLPIASLGSYEEYDHVDDMDDSGISGPPVQLSNASGNEGSNAEDIPLLLPSTLGWEWCVSHGVKSLAINEAKLRYAQANDSIHRIRLALGFKLALFRTQVRDARTQQTKTRAWTAIHSVDTSVHQHARSYSMARDAYLKVQDASGESPELPQLCLADLRVNTAILGAAKVGQRNKQLPWIWSFGTSVKKDGTWMDECK
jgi:hypothetical protein